MWIGVSKTPKLLPSLPKALTKVVYSLTRKSQRSICPKKNCACGKLTMELALRHTCGQLPVNSRSMSTPPSKAVYSVTKNEIAT
jgi:hypothetical protein